MTKTAGRFSSFTSAGSWAKADSASFVPEFERFAMAGDKSGEDLPEIRNWKWGA